jgi:uncharacterized membrane protein YfcA
MALAQDGLLLAAAAVAGAVNSVAGGGTLLSFPAAMAWGLPSTVANATNALAMTPGSLSSAWAYRRELRAARPLVWLLAGPALAGGVVGAIILHHTSARLFDRIVPWLVLGATLLILFQGRRAGRRPETEGPRVTPAGGGPSRGRKLAAVACQLGVGIYGGYFGAAMGIVTLGFLGLLVPDDVQRRNAIKNLLAALINGVASIYFVAVGLVSLRPALLMTAGAVTGGFAGAALARRASPRAVKGLVVAIGLALSALLAYRAYAVARGS